MLARGSGEVLTRVRLPAHLCNDGQSALHPALLDACLHLYPALVDAYGDFELASRQGGGIYLPVGVECFRCTGKGAGQVWAHGARRTQANGNAESLTVDIVIYHDDGRFAAAIEGLSLKPLPPDALQPGRIAEKEGPLRQAAQSGRAAGATPARFQLGEAPQARRRELLLALVSQEAMQVLGITEIIDTARPLREVGLDSLMSVRLVNRLEAALGIKVPAVSVLPGPSIAQLVAQLLPELTATLADSGKPIPLSGKGGTDCIGSVGGNGAAPQPAMLQSESAAASWPIGEHPPAQGSPRPIVIETQGRANRWLVMVGPRTSARLRLFCFPFAGGGSAVYRSWADSIDPTIEVVAVEPPGRLGRIGEPPIADMNKLVEQLAAEMVELVDRPFAFFGHCLGGLTLYETARRLIHTTMLRPEHLFVSGARPPDQITDQGKFEQHVMRDLLKLAQFRVDVPTYAQPDDVFAELIRHFDIQATEELLDDAELRRLMLPVIRAEFQMASNYQFRREPPWEIPITCFAAKGDPYVSRRHVLGWGRFTNSRLQVHIRDGAHFAVVDDAAFIHSVINRELAGRPEGASNGAGAAPW
jgi:surfactin synthase thioesterase subunit/acyl carrier protein